MAKRKRSLLYFISRRYVQPNRTTPPPLSLSICRLDLDDKMHVHEDHANFSSCLWLVGNIPGCEIKRGDQIFKYAPPRTQLGEGTRILHFHISILAQLHRILLFSQNSDDISFSYSIKCTPNVSPSKEDSSTV